MREFTGKKRCRRSPVLMVAVAVLLIVSVLAAGCRTSGKTQQQDPGNPPVSPNPGETKTTLTLYFADKEAQFLVPEKREVIRKGESAEEAVVRELIAGPADTAHGRTIPPETKLISISVANGVAYANFSKELKTKHWGGSAGETMTVYSVVNSLAELPGITEVQFLIDGAKVESLAGHIELEAPLRPDWRLVPDRPVKLGTVQIDLNRVKEIQASVDNGHQPWRLDPAQVAIEEGLTLGLNPARDSFKLVFRNDRPESSQPNEARVEVTRGQKTYLVRLVQPNKQGPAGIWIISSLEEK